MATPVTGSTTCLLFCLRTRLRHRHKKVRSSVSWLSTDMLALLSCSLHYWAFRLFLISRFWRQCCNEHLCTRSQILSCGLLGALPLHPVLASGGPRWQNCFHKVRQFLPSHGVGIYGEAAKGTVSKPVGPCAVPRMEAASRHQTAPTARRTTATWAKWKRPVGLSLTKQSTSIKS